MSKNKIKNDELGELINDLFLAPEAGLMLADPNLVAFYKDYNERTLWIDKDISDSLFAEIRAIIQWNREDDMAKIPVEKRKKIILLIHSYGGNIDAAFSLIDVINTVTTPVITVNMQCALSAGALILINGHKGMRYCLPMSQALIHSGSGSQGGSYEQVVAQTDNYKKMIGMMHKNILEHTKIDQQTMNKWKSKEIYLYAEDQVEYGLVDKIIKNFNELYE